MGKLLEKSFDVQRLLKLEQISIAEETKIKAGWEEAENFFLGAQWGKAFETNKKKFFNSQGHEIVVRFYDDEGNKVEMPKRVQNEIFIHVQAQLALHLKQNYYLVSEPSAKTDKAKTKSLKQNLYFQKVLGDKFATDFLQVIQDVCIFGNGFLKIVKKSNVSKNDVPFAVERINPFDVSVDPSANRFEDIQWIIFKTKKYAKDVFDAYETKIDGVDDYQILELKEFWVKQNVLVDGAKIAVWKRYVLYKNELLNKEEAEKINYPIHPVAHFYAYKNIKGFWGISEVSLLIEQQRQINKRLSQYDYYLTKRVIPPVEIVGNAIKPDQAAKIPLRAGDFIEVNAAGSIRPVIEDVINEGAFFNSIETSRNYMRRITGVQQVFEGANEQGVYSARHFNSIYESAVSRLKLKEEYYRSSFKMLGESLLLWGEKFLGKTGKFSVYSPAEDRFIDITANDLDFMDTSINLRTSDANLLDPQARLEFLVKLKQYAPEFDTKEIILLAEKIYPTFFNREYIKFIENITKLEREITMKKMEMEAGSLQPQPPMPPVSGGDADEVAEGNVGEVMPPQPPSPLPEVQGKLAEYVNKVKEALLQQGIDEESINNFLKSAMIEAMRNGIEEEDAVISFLENNLMEVTKNARQEETR